MAREPSYPEDAAVGTPEETLGGENTQGPAPADNSRRNKQIMTGAAIGIGSAALVAALLYANRSKKNPRGDS